MTKNQIKFIVSLLKDELYSVNVILDYSRLIGSKAGVKRQTKKVEAINETINALRCKYAKKTRKL